jgi:hypothetical protein
LKQVGDLRRSIEGLHHTKMMADERAYNGWTQTVAALSRQVDEFNTTPMLTTPAVYDNLAGMAKELQTTTKSFRENPKKYLRVKVF